MKDLIEKLKKLLGLSKKSTGFTLIELLVVIGILGVLAAALVATIDPFEQLKKANDSKIKNIVVEFQNANVRYFTTHTAFPWNDSNLSNDGCIGVGAADITASPLNETPGIMDCVGKVGVTSGSLIADGELKASFISNTKDLEQVLVTWVLDSQEVTVCFAPTSKSQKASKETVYNDDGSAADPAVCPNANAAPNTCFWCTK